MKLFKRAFIAIGLVLILHAVLLFTGLYDTTEIDVLMHFLGGFAVGLLGIAVHQAGSLRAPWWYRYLFVTGFAILIGVAWEFHEYILDRTLFDWFGFAPSQPSVGDTMMDLLMDWLGASVAFFWLRKQV